MISLVEHSKLTLLEALFGATSLREMGLVFCQDKIPFKGSDREEPLDSTEENL